MIVKASETTRNHLVRHWTDSALTNSNDSLSDMCPTTA